MRICIGRIIELICPNCVGKLGGKVSRLVVVIGGVLVCDGRDGVDFCAEHAKEVYFFLTLDTVCLKPFRFVHGNNVKREDTNLSIGHKDNTSVPLGSAHMCETNTRVSCSAFNDGSSRF